MSGKHLCQSRLSAAYISSNRYMHIILFYFRFFILLSPGLPFIRLSSFFIRTSFALPSSFPHPSSGFSTSFIRPCSSLPSSFFTFHPAFSLSLSTVLPLVFPTGFSPSFPMFPLRHSLCSPVIPALVSVIPGSTGNPLPSGASPPCHPERQRRIFPHGFLHNN